MTNDVVALHMEGGTVYDLYQLARIVQEQGMRSAMITRQLMFTCAFVRKEGHTPREVAKVKRLCATTPASRGMEMRLGHGAAERIVTGVGVAALRELHSLESEFKERGQGEVYAVLVALLDVRRPQLNQEGVGCETFKELFDLAKHLEIGESRAGTPKGTKTVLADEQMKEGWVLPWHYVRPSMSAEALVQWHDSGRPVRRLDHFELLHVKVSPDSEGAMLLTEVTRDLYERVGTALIEAPPELRRYLLKQRDGGQLSE